jgi:hypothetical protein
MLDTLGFGRRRRRQRTNEERDQLVNDERARKRDEQTPDAGVPEEKTEPSAGG